MHRWETSYHEDGTLTYEMLENTEGSCAEKMDQVSVGTVIGEERTKPDEEPVTETVSG